MISPNIFITIGVAVFFMVSAFIFTLKNDISNLKEENLTLQKDYTSCLVSNTSLKGSLTSQNMKIKENEVDLKNKMEELKKWKEQPAQVKYKTIEKIITKENSNECKDIKTILDDIRTTSF